MPISTSTHNLLQRTRAYRRRSRLPRARALRRSAGPACRCGEEAGQDARGRAPHRLVVELEEVHRAASSPQSCQRSSWWTSSLEQLRERDVEDALHLARIGRRAPGGALDQPDERRDQERPDDACASCRARRSRRPRRGGRPISSSASRSAASRGVASTRGVDLAARERDLAPVVGIVSGRWVSTRRASPSCSKSGHEHRGVAGVGLERRPRQRAAGGRRSGPARRAATTRAGRAGRRPTAPGSQRGPRLAGGCPDGLPGGSRGIRGYFFFPPAILASTSRLDSTSRSSPSTLTSVPPYFE